MRLQLRLGLALFFLLALCGASLLRAQQKGQYIPGQFGLNAGVTPPPGITYENLVVNYSADRLNDSSGNALPNVTGTYSLWFDENIFMFVPHHKILGGFYVPYAMVSWASGSMVADFSPVSGINLGGVAGGSGLSDTWVEPLNLGWHLSRADMQVGYAFVAPTGRFTAGATNNTGSGYWGNHINGGATVYLTKNKGTSANLFSDWEVHKRKSGTNMSPGQTFTMEWGVGQALPLRKDESLLAQLGVVGYDQWQMSSNKGTIGSIPASLIPNYSAHAIGIQTNLIAPKPSLLGFFKYYWEYAAHARVQGRTIVFGFTWTFKIPKNTH
jgi:hypothetical protein